MIAQPKNLRPNKAITQAKSNRVLLKLLEEYQVQCLVFEYENDRQLIQFFRLQPGWGIDFEDGDVVFFVRTNTGNDLNKEEKS
jgi:hypothetical protein